MEIYTLSDQIAAHRADIAKIKARAAKRCERLDKPYQLTMREYREISLLEIMISAAQRCQKLYPNE